MGREAREMMSNPKIYAMLATLTTLVYDYSITLGQEVDLVWSRPFTFGTGLFFVTRYLPFIDLPITVSAYSSFNEDITAEECLRRIRTATVLQMVGICVAQLILVLRTIAIWERKLTVIVSLAVLYWLAVSCSVYVVVLFLKTLRFQKWPFQPCTTSHVDKIIFVDFVIILLMETVVVGLTGLKALKHTWWKSSSWIIHLYKRGFIYFLLIFMASVVNLLLLLLAPDNYKLIFTDAQRVLHSILCNRVILMILAQKEKVVQPLAVRSNEDTHWRFARPTSMIETALDLDIFTSPAETPNNSRTKLTSDLGGKRDSSLRTLQCVTP
ncbi:hypothetical protein CPB83DRAFT_366374 [Crepidotus variabilis]|uniref:DUF6533 domain-containing protein n=1 Tax=Crepidotus variabilis TaxID=179855 RepID=A0A9P6EFC4_9AGAR|nr:hypothetical protein CPB83DRAFT_366374 [Crepidotus variabilis]